MQIDDDDIYDVLLICLRLTAWLNIPSEHGVLTRCLLDSGLPQDVLDIWQNPQDFNPEEAIEEMWQNLGFYRPMILGNPEFFAKDPIARCISVLFARHDIRPVNLDLQRLTG